MKRMVDEYKRARSERERLYEQVLGVLSKYPQDTTPEKVDLNKKPSNPFPPGVHWEIEFRATKELARFFGTDSETSTC
jgi:hypothetical protein